MAARKGTPGSKGEKKVPPSRMMTADDFRARGQTHLHFAVPSELHRQAKIYAATYQTTMQELVIEALQDRLKKGKGSGK